jgi:hypothetical protein
VKLRVRRRSWSHRIPCCPPFRARRRSPGRASRPGPSRARRRRAGRASRRRAGSGEPAAPGSDEQSYWHDYGRTEFGEDWYCNKYDGAAVNYVVPAPPVPYVWRLIVLRKGDLDHLFFDPPVGATLDTGGSYDHVIACKHIPQVETETGALLVKKYGIDHALVGGAVFTITPGDIQMVELWDGVFCTSGLDPAVTYTVTETTPPAGYAKADPDHRTASPVAGTNCTDNRPGSAHYVEFVNVPVPGKVKVEKVDGEGEPLANVSFNLSGDGYDVTITTDASGHAMWTNLPFGSYTLSEDVPAGFALGTVTFDGVPVELPYTFTVGLGSEPGLGMTYRFHVENIPTEGVWCSPGFWWNSPIAAAAAAAAGGFSLDDPYADFFAPIDGDPTLWQVLSSPQTYGGGPFNNVGDLLSDSHPDVNFTGERVGDSCPLSADASMGD